jgi:hypothetical protein
MTDDATDTARIVVEMSPGAAFELLFPWGNADARRDIIEQTLELGDDHDREIAGAIRFVDESFAFEEIYRRLREEGERDPSLGDIAENAVTHAAGPRHEWTNREYFRHVVALMVEEYRDDFARYDARRCDHTTRAGLRCLNRADGCPSHNPRSS